MRAIISRGRFPDMPLCFVVVWITTSMMVVVMAVVAKGDPFEVRFRKRTIGNV